jgi:hypothetical protein
MRCEFTDLLVEHCAHCKGKVDPEVDEVDPMEGARLIDMGDEKEHSPRAFQAEYPGTCLHCGNHIEPGEFIMGVLKDATHWSDGFKGYAHEMCP